MYYQTFFFHFQYRNPEQFLTNRLILHELVLQIQTETETDRFVCQRWGIFRSTFKLRDRMYAACEWQVSHESFGFFFPLIRAERWEWASWGKKAALLLLPLCSSTLLFPPLLRGCGADKHVYATGLFISQFNMGCFSRAQFHLWCYSHKYPLTQWHCREHQLIFVFQNIIIVVVAVAVVITKALALEPLFR